MKICTKTITEPTNKINKPIKPSKYSGNVDLSPQITPHFAW